ncbi:MAG: hypothetical protein AB1446_04490 [Bacillota bacterium]
METRRAGLELVAESAVIIIPGVFLIMDVAFDHQVPLAWSGSDVYELNGTVLGGRRVAASGRHRTYRETSLPLGLGTVEAAPAVPAPRPEYVRRTRVKLHSNLFLDPGQLLAGLTAHWVDEAGQVILDIPLRRPDVSLDWLGRGLFVLDVSGQVQALLARL